MLGKYVETMPILQMVNEPLDRGGLLRALQAFRSGDFSVRLSADRGGNAEVAAAFNELADLMQAMASEFGRVHEAFGKQGQADRRIRVAGAAGSWLDAIEAMNALLDHSVSVGREVARVAGAVAQGDLTKRMRLQIDGHALRGDTLRFAEAINAMAAQLATFAAEVSRVAHEIGTQGRLGAEASVPGAAGTWNELTLDVNRMASNLATQTRAIAEVVGAVTQGDLTRSITVEAQGEVASLKEDINRMIRSLEASTRRNAEQEWLKGSLARFVRMLQAERDLAGMSKRILSELAPLLDAQQGVLYVQRGHGEDTRLELFASYALGPGQNLPRTLRLGETLVGQCAQEKKRIVLTGVPRSVLGSASPLAVIIVPALYEGGVKAVIELASLHPFGETQLVFLEQLAESIGTALHAVEAESLLRRRQDELQRKNEELQDKAEQLALASHYKSEFLANMSHELRTPLNSLLILARLLVDNPDGTLAPKQLEYLRTIHAAGADLLELINEILDLAKIESGTVVLDIDAVQLAGVLQDAERTFRQVALDKRLQFRVSAESAVPPTMRTDARRLQQILKNLLSNAFKFTESGSVTLRVERARSGWTPGHAGLDGASGVVAFMVEDTGIGIPDEKRRSIFQAFRQADGSADDRHEGTGLGLSICLQLTRLLGGEIRVESLKGAGSRFTVFLPFSPGAQVESALRQRQREELPLGPRPRAAQAALAGLAGRKVLIIDDDIRNVFALTGALEEHGIRVLDAESGSAGLDSLKREPDVDAVLMDMMMPGLDGFDSIRMIRSQHQFRDLPIIAVTARAMKGDREKCIEAGATDYLSKPVDVGQLLAQLQSCLAK